MRLPTTKDEIQPWSGRPPLLMTHANAANERRRNAPSVRHGRRENAGMTQILPPTMILTLTRDSDAGIDGAELHMAHLVALIKDRHTTHVPQPHQWTKEQLQTDCQSK